MRSPIKITRDLRIVAPPDASLQRVLAEVLGRTPDPELVSFEKSAETDPRFAAAKEVVKRYRRAKGYPEVTAERIEAHRAYMREVTALVEARGWENVGRLGAPRENDGAQIDAGRRSFTRNSERCHKRCHRGAAAK